MIRLPYLAINSGSGGGGGTGDTIISGSVSTYANLPSAGSYTGKYYIVDTNTGTWILGTLKKAGIYKSNGTTWVYVDNVPETTSLSDGTTVITGTNIILTGTNGISTLTDTANNKITISAPSALSGLSGTNTGDETASGIKTKLETLSGTNRLDASAIKNILESQITNDRTFVYVLNGSQQNISTANTWTKVTTGISSTATLDTKTEYNGTNREITVKEAGWYRISYKAYGYSNAGILWRFNIYKNGTAAGSTAYPGVATSDGLGWSASELFNLAANDVISFYAFASDVSSGANVMARVWIERVM